MKRRKYKPRRVNLEPQSFVLTDAFGESYTKIVYAGDSLTTVPCPNCIRKWMRQNLFNVGRRSNVVFPLRMRTARELIEELELKRKM